jgi:glycosyltransferase 2 family protein
MPELTIRRSEAISVLTVWKSKLGSLVRAILSISLMAALVYHIGSGEIISQLRLVSWHAIAAVTLMLTTSVLLVTPRWAIILSVLGCRTTLSVLIGSVFLGFLFNQLLPTAVGGDVLRAWRAKQLGAPWETAIYSVLIDRGTGVLISLTGAAALLPIAGFHNGQARLEWIIAAIAALLVAGLLVLRLLSRFPRSSIPLLAGIHGMLVRLHDSIWTFATRPGATAAVIVLAALNQMLPVAAVLIFARTLGVTLPVADLAFITFISTLAATVPISVAGWGIREGALVYLFGLYGVRPDVAFAISILCGFALTLSSTPGLYFMARARTEPPSADDEFRPKQA